MGRVKGQNHKRKPELWQIGQRRFLTASTVALLVGLDRKSVYLMTERGKFPGSFRHGLGTRKDRRYPIQTVITYMQDAGIPIPPQLLAVQIEDLLFFGAEVPAGNFPSLHVAASLSEVGVIATRHSLRLAVIGDCLGIAGMAESARCVRKLQPAARILLAVSPDVTRDRLTEYGLSTFRTVPAPVSWASVFTEANAEAVTPPPPE
jgi:hypothetical protein